MLPLQTANLTNQPMKKSRLIALYLLQYIPVLSSFLLMLHVGLLLMGFEFGVLEAELGFSLMSVMMLVLFTFMLMMFSVIFRFCWLHRTFIIYTSVVQFCILIRPTGMFDGWLTGARWAMFIPGVLIFGHLITHIRQYHDCNKNTKRPSLITANCRG